MHDSIERGCQSIAGHPPSLHYGKRQGYWHSTSERFRPLVSCLVPPCLQVAEIGHLLGSHCMRGLKVEQKSEAVEVPLYRIVARVPFLERQVNRELRLGRRLETRGDGSDPDLGAFRV